MSSVVVSQFYPSGKANYRGGGGGGGREFHTTSSASQCQLLYVLGSERGSLRRSLETTGRAGQFCYYFQLRQETGARLVERVFSPELSPVGVTSHTFQSCQEHPNRHVCWKNCKRCLPLAVNRLRQGASVFLYFFCRFQREWERGWKWTWKRKTGKKGGHRLEERERR
jgi:hypothetical protein